MKKLFIILLFPFLALAQDTVSRKWTPFSFTPVGQGTYRVNGLAMGVGLGFPYNDTKKVTINGLNIEANPLSLFYFMFMEPERIGRDSVYARVNGLHISTAGLMGNTQLNGLGISFFNVGAVSNGVNISVLYNVNRVMNGVHVGVWGNEAEEKANGLLMGMSNSSRAFNGVMLGGINHSETFRGLSLGITNRVTGEMTGLQIGLLNRTKKLRGLQIGLWNVNEKRSLPIINW